MLPFHVILVEQEGSRTTTFVAHLERAPDVGSVVELPQGRILVQDVLSADRDGLAGVVLAAPA